MNYLHWNKRLTILHMSNLSTLFCAPRLGTYLLLPLDATPTTTWSPFDRFFGYAVRDLHRT